MARNYYIILGVDADATQEQIKTAYRRKAKRLHPDCYEGSRQPFMEVQEAYEVLGDPARRRAYDSDLDRERLPRSAPPRARRGPFRSGRCHVEPLIPTERPTPPQGTGARPFQDAYGRLWDNWIDRGQRGPAQADELRISAVLTPRQALDGGRLHLRLPVRVTCPACSGQGGVGYLSCAYCAGAGSIVDERPVSVSFPAGIADGSIARVPLNELGLRSTCLLIEFSVRAW